jgi:hypothetical protein
MPYDNVLPINMRHCAYLDGTHVLGVAHGTSLVVVDIGQG